MQMQLTDNKQSLLLIHAVTTIKSIGIMKHKKSGLSRFFQLQQSISCYVMHQYAFLMVDDSSITRSLNAYH